MAFFTVQEDPKFEGLLYSEKQARSHNNPYAKIVGNMEGKCHLSY